MLQVIGLGAILAWINALDKSANERQVREATKKFIGVEIEHLGSMIRQILAVVEELPEEKQAFLLNEIFQRYEQIQKRINGGNL